MPLTTAGATRILNGGALKPVCTHMLLLTGNPGNSGSFSTEVAAGVGYSRIPVTWTGSSYVIENSGDLLFEATANWGTITWVGFASSATRASGTMYVRHQLPSPVTVLANQKLRFVSGNIEIEGMRT